MIDTQQTSYQSQLDADTAANFRIAQEAYIQQRREQAYIDYALSETQLNQAASHPGTLGLENADLDPRYPAATEPNKDTIHEVDVMPGSAAYIQQAGHNLAMIRERFTLAA